MQLGDGQPRQWHCRRRQLTRHSRIAVADGLCRPPKNSTMEQFGTDGETTSRASAVENNGRKARQKKQPARTLHKGTAFMRRLLILSVFLMAADPLPPVTFHLAPRASGLGHLWSLRT